MTVTPEVTEWTRSHVFDIIWVIGIGVALAALRVVVKASR